MRKLCARRQRVTRYFGTIAMPYFIGMNKPEREGKRKAKLIEPNFSKNLKMSETHFPYLKFFYILLILRVSQPSLIVTIMDHHHYHG